MENIFIGYYLNRKLKNGKKKTQNFISIAILVSPLVNAKGLIRFISSPTIYVIDAITIIALAYTVVNYLYFTLYIKPYINEAGVPAENNSVKGVENNTKQKTETDSEDFDPSKLIPRKNYSNPDTSEQDKRIEKAKSSILSKREAIAKKTDEHELKVLDPAEEKNSIKSEPVEKSIEKKANQSEIESINIIEEESFSEIKKIDMESDFLNALNERNNGIIDNKINIEEEDDFVEEEIVEMNFNIPEEEVKIVEETTSTLKQQVAKIKGFTEMINELANAPVFEHTDYSTSLEYFNHPEIEVEDMPYDGVLNAVEDITDVLEQITISETEDHLNHESNPTMNEYEETNLIPGESGLFKKKKKKKSIFED